MVNNHFVPFIFTAFESRVAFWSPSAEKFHSPFIHTRILHSFIPISPALTCEPNCKITRGHICITIECY